MRPETWLEQLSHELATRGLTPVDVASIVVELQGHLTEAGGDPLGVFGSPAEYASRVAASIGPVEAPVRRPGRPRIRVRDLAMSYRRRPVLRGVSLDVRAGEVLLLVGPNGAGKSTLLRIVAGLTRPTSGHVAVSGPIGYAPQSGGLFEHLTPAEHLVLFGRGRGLTRARAQREGQHIAAQLGWDAMSDGQVVGELSGGTRQKLNVVLAGLGDPDVLLLDEPYQGLDWESTRRFWELLWAWRDAGRAALVVSHAHDALDRVDAVMELGVPSREVAR